MTDFSDLIGQAKKMQEKMKETQENLKKIEVEGVSGGDSVKIINGPFIDFNGVIDEINQDKQKVKVIVSIFGRPTPVELDFFQVEKYN